MPLFNLSASHPLLILVLSLQLVSGTQAFFFHGHVDNDEDTEDERSRRRITAAAVSGGVLLLILLAWFIYAWRKKRARARVWTTLEPVYPPIQGGLPGSFPPGTYAPGYGQGPMPAYMPAKNNNALTPSFAYQPPPPPPPSHFV